MNPGLLDRRITLMRRTVVADGAGAPVETWADCGTIHGQRLQANGREMFAAGANRSNVAEAFRVRFSQALNDPASSGNLRARYNGRDYNIESALEDPDASLPRRAYMLLALSYVQGEPTLRAVPPVP